MSRPPKSEETRGRILEAAIELFRERGFEAATMREIAGAAGVATGAAYYYFDSKDAIVLAFYDRARLELAPGIEKALADAHDFESRLRSVIETKLAYFEPDRGLLRALAAHTDPEHPLSPFSAQTHDIREQDIFVFQKLLAESRLRLPKDIAPRLPRILWLYQLGVILFWIYDRSDGHGRTQRLLTASISIIGKLIRLSVLPLFRPARKAVIELMETVFLPSPPMAG